MGTKPRTRKAAPKTTGPTRRPPSPSEPEELAARAAAALPAFLPSQRWFGAKARAVAGAAPLDHAVVPGTEGILALFEVTYADGGRETYLVPVAPGTADSAFADAMDQPSFCLALLEQVRGAAFLAGRLGTFRFTPTEAFADVVPAPPREAITVRTEQSNTSVIFEGRAILKLFRRLQPGPNPDFEVPDFLTRHTAFRGSPRLAGSIAYEALGQEPTTLAVLHEFVRNEGDAWTGALKRLAEYYAAAVSDPPFARTLAAADAKEAERLGRLTGHLHMALGSAAGGAPLASEPIGAEDLAAWRAGMRALLDRVMGTVAGTLDSLPEASREAARPILDDAPRLREALEALNALASERVTKIRIHGDYHLGQVLLAGERFMIVDFEGEPARPLPERRAKHCALKDVAGMLRSFSYAAHAALFRAVEEAPEDRTLGSRLASWAEAWEEGTRRAFLEGYLAETWERGAPFLPRGRETLDAVLRVYELDKAIYELEYEIQNRPAWVRIPLEGLRRAVAAAPEPGRPRLRLGEGPFHFVACLELREFVGVRAENERQLADLIEEVPLESIYYHTHAFFLRHKFVAGPYHNDFATWAAVQVRDRVLGERLAMVDPAELGSLPALREELASVIDEHLRHLQDVPRIIFGEPFDFIQSRIVEIPTGIQVRTLQEFRDALLEVDASAVYFHLVAAQVRLGRGRNDFAAWLEAGLGLPALAARVQALDPYAGTLERTRARLVQLCDEALVEGTSR